ncbi:hypothetical protein AAG906_030453 [Vitis piasezkii]|uniref:Uncharacterized protein n=2 Tax=Vitis vinifera TaxID=29760 RepID=A0ABY9DPW2_VITVI|nr:protein SOB FIVE-LIKE 5 [Vitis vinifera]XP_034676703.1 uncharacterized protein LOC117907309 [Vitis riparia]WKA09814.1 hypothetical protein VitviT2T_027432 [Vitis vinifera]|eukprot:XP_010664495.1 PREDICTED: uncharacterized protein LOC100854033 [Vitis vinifera]
MNISASQCSSGCESGWTLYLDQSSSSANECRRAGRVVDEDCGRKNAEVGQQDEEEDLSMVSDASSGPPHFHEDENCFSQAAKKSQKKKIKDPCTKQQHSSLDDTASSPVLSFSKKKFSPTSDQGSMEHGLDFSQGFSATHFKGKSAFQKHIGFFKSSFADKPPSDQPGGCEGREWE